SDVRLAALVLHAAGPDRRGHPAAGSPRATGRGGGPSAAAGAAHVDGLARSAGPAVRRAVRLARRSGDEYAERDGRLGLRGVEPRHQRVAAAAAETRDPHDRVDQTSAPTRSPGARPAAQPPMRTTARPVTPPRRITGTNSGTCSSVMSWAMLSVRPFGLRSLASRCQSGPRTAIGHITDSMP